MRTMEEEIFDHAETIENLCLDQNRPPEALFKDIQAECALIKRRLELGDPE